MAAGNYKSGVAIIVVYQAIACETGLVDVQMNVYDQAHALDAGKSGVMAEIEVDTGRYWKTFTPGAEGEWTVTCAKADASGAVVKSFAVCGHDVDSIGDALATTDGKIDTIDGIVDAIKLVTDDLADGERLDLLIDGIKANTDDLADGERIDLLIDAIKAKTDNIGATVAPAGEYDTEMARITADVATEAKQDAIDAVVDAIKLVTDDWADAGRLDALLDAIKAVTDAESGVKAVADAIKAKTDNIGASVAPANEYDTELDQNLSTTESNIRGADSDTLETLSDQIDGVSAPAMVG